MTIPREIIKKEEIKNRFPCWVVTQVRKILMAHPETGGGGSGRVYGTVDCIVLKIKGQWSEIQVSRKTQEQAY